MFGNKTTARQTANKEDLEKIYDKLDAIDLQVGDITRMIRTLAYKLDASPVLATEYEDDGQKDKLYVQAEAVVREAGKASTALLQRKMGIGYGRAARLIDMLEDRKVISRPQRTTTVRRVLEKDDNAERCGPTDGAVSR